MPIEVISSDSYTIVVDIITDFDLELTAEQAKQAREDGSTGSDQKIKNPPTIVFAMIPFHFSAGRSMILISI